VAQELVDHRALEELREVAPLAVEVDEPLSDGLAHHLDHIERERGEAVLAAGADDLSEPLRARHAADQHRVDAARVAHRRAHELLIRIQEQRAVPLEAALDAGMWIAL